MQKYYISNDTPLNDIKNRVCKKKINCTFENQQYGQDNDISDTTFRIFLKIVFIESNSNAKLSV